MGLSGKTRRQGKIHPGRSPAEGKLLSRLLRWTSLLFCSLGNSPSSSSPTGKAVPRPPLPGLPGLRSQQAQEMISRWFTLFSRRKGWQAAPSSSLWRQARKRSGAGSLDTVQF